MLGDVKLSAIMLARFGEGEPVLKPVWPKVGALEGRVNFKLDFPSYSNSGHICMWAQSAGKLLYIYDSPHCAPLCCAGIVGELKPELPPPRNVSQSQQQQQQAKKTKIKNDDN